MILILKNDVLISEIDRIILFLAQKGLNPIKIKTQNYLLILCDDSKEVELVVFSKFNFIKEILNISIPYKLVSRVMQESSTIISLDKNVSIGSDNFSIMAGPCSIESESQVIQVIEQLKKNDVKIMRGGVFKPRSSPYSFRGHGFDGLKMFSELAKANDIKIISEVMDSSQIDQMYDYVDMFQVGSRNGQNFNLLQALGEIDKPVMIKRAISGTIEELLLSAEYVFSAGNDNIILCERGIRTYENAYRNTFDINAIPILKEKSHLPVIADPSHGIGLRSHVIPIALAATIAGCDGLIVEVHPEPENSISDSKQTIDFTQFEDLVNKIKLLKEVYN